MIFKNIVIEFYSKLKKGNFIKKNSILLHINFPKTSVIITSFIQKKKNLNQIQSQASEIFCVNLYR